MIYFLDSIEYESTLGELRYQGNTVMLSGLGTRVLNYFIENPNKLINYDELMEKVWGRIVTENAVFQVIQHIRQSYKEIKPDGEVIKTIRSKGFQLNQSIVPTEKSSHKKAWAMNKWWAIVPLASLIFIALMYWQKNTKGFTNSPNRLIILSNDKDNELTEHFAPATAMLLNRLLKFSENSDVVNLDRYSTAKEKHQTAQKLWQLNPDLNLVTTNLSQKDSQFVLTVEMIKGQNGTLKQVFSSDRLSDVLI